MNERHPPATREDHDTFCEREQWTVVRGAAGRPVRHHRTYELSLWDGRILRTRISRPINRTTYAASMWAHILRQQLEVTASEFWACAKKEQRPDRGQPAQKQEKRGVPLYLFRALRDLGVSENDIIALDVAAAAALHARLLGSG